MDKIDQKPKTKTFLIGKELKKNTLRHTAAERRERGTQTKTTPKPSYSLRQGASAFLLCLSIDIFIFICSATGLLRVRQSGSPVKWATAVDRDAGSRVAVALAQTPLKRIV